MDLRAPPVPLVFLLYNDNNALGSTGQSSTEINTRIHYWLTKFQSSLQKNLSIEYEIHFTNYKAPSLSLKC